MNILVISHFFESDVGIGSVRWTSLAHRLAKKHNIYVVTHSLDKKNTSEISGNLIKFYVDNECKYFKHGAKRRAKSKAHIDVPKISKNKINFIKTFKNFLKASLYMFSMQSTSKKNAKHISEWLKCQNVELDYVICTSRPFISCFLAYYLCKKKRIPWLLDQRDLPYSDGASKMEITSFKNAFHHFDKFVSKYTLVSHGMADDFLEFCRFGETEKNKTFVLNNGFAKENMSASAFYPKQMPLSIAYAGVLYDGKRDATLLFDALNKVLDNTNLSITDFRIDYVGKNGESLYLNAEKYRLNQIIFDHGYVSRTKAIEIQQKADLLLLLTWNTTMNKGILPGKIYEYMMVEKPIICITAGEIPNGEAEGMVKDMNLGVAVNYCNYEQGVNELAEYISEQIKRKKSNEPLLFNPDTAKVQEFDYDNLVKKLESIMF